MTHHSQRAFALCRSARLAVLATALATLSCAATTESAPRAAQPQKREYPGTLLPPGALAYEFQWRQKVTPHWPTGSRSFDAVLAKSDEELQLLGLNPMGMPGFVLRLTGAGIEFENRTEQQLPFEPRVILLDVQRVFYPWFDESAPNQGERQRELNNEVITERWNNGKIVERRFRRSDGAADGEIVVQYFGWQANADAPARAVLVNRWFGYRLEVETLEQQRL
jgi:hypothetical protein